MEQQIFHEAVTKFDTPCYMFDLDALQRRSILIREKLGEKITICYAMKANPFLVKPMDALVDRFEVCSPGEYQICMRQNINPEKILISGVNKTKESMKQILELGQGKGIFTIESFRHFEILKECVAETGRNISVYLRLSSGNQFGIDKEHLEQLLLELQEEAKIQMKGIHYYSGTQKKFDKVKKELEELSDYGRYLRETYHLKELELEYGPGLSVAYFETDKGECPTEQLEQLKTLLGAVDGFTHISIEFGRFMVSECGHYLTKVVDRKETEQVHYLIVDGGIHQLHYYGQMMGMKKPFMTWLKERTENREKYQICGSLCTMNDVIVRDVEIGRPKIGDVLVFHRCGGYSVTEGMALFLSRELPQILFYTVKNGFHCVREPMGTDLFNSQKEDIG